MSIERDKRLIEFIKDSIKRSRDEQTQLVAVLRMVESSLDLNQFTDKVDAQDTIYDRLRGYAEEDCEGTYSCGADSYSQIFSVNGTLYEAILYVEYNRHDKKFYYVDGTDLHVEEINV